MGELLLTLIQKDKLKSVLAHMLKMMLLLIVLVTRMNRKMDNFNLLDLIGVLKSLLIVLLILSFFFTKKIFKKILKSFLIYESIIFQQMEKIKIIFLVLKN